MLYWFIYFGFVVFARVYCLGSFQIWLCLDMLWFRLYCCGLICLVCGVLLLDADWECFVVHLGLMRVTGALSFWLSSVFFCGTFCVDRFW